MSGKRSKILEKSGKNQGISSGRKSGNPVVKFTKYNDVRTAETTDISNNKLLLLSLEVMVALLQTKFHTSTVSAAHKNLQREESLRGEVYLLLCSGLFWFSC